MDPNATLRELRRLAAQIIADADPEDYNPQIARAERVAELVEALDTWITRGGFLPAAWMPAPPAGD